MTSRVRHILKLQRNTISLILGFPRNARINFRQFEADTFHGKCGIYNELRMRGYSVDVGVVIIAEKDQEGKVNP